MNSGQFIHKPWINPDIKALLKKKKRAFKSGNKDELKAVQRLLRRKIREWGKTPTRGRWRINCSRKTPVESGEA